MRNYKRKQVSHAQFALAKVTLRQQFHVVSVFYTSHLVSVVVPAVGAGYDHHPVLATVWILGRKRIYQPETQAEQCEED